MNGNFDEFNRQLEGLIEKQLPERALKFQLKVAGDAIDGVIKRTPVLDGLLRFNWQASVYGPIDTVRDGSDAEGEGQATRAEAKATLKAQLHPYGTAYLSNPTPYASVIEDGGYPSPVKRGTRIRNARRRQRRRGLLDRSAEAREAFLLAGETADYEIRSAGGFSKRAPQGMVGVTVLELQDYFERD